MGNHDETNDENVETERTEISPADVVTPYLEIELRHIPENTARFTEELAKFLHDQEGSIPWLQISNLRLMAQSLRQAYEQVDGLLGILEERTETHRDE